MTYETLVMYGGELIAIPESTVVGALVRILNRIPSRIPLPSALLTKFRSEKLKNNKDRMQKKIGDDGSGILVEFQSRLVFTVGIQFHRNISDDRTNLS